MGDDHPPTVAVTGAAGYLGSRVVAALQERHPGWNVLAVDDFSRGNLQTVGDVPVSSLDVRNRGALERVLQGVDGMAHLAAVSGVDDCEANPDRAYEVNVQGTENVAWFCRKTGAMLVHPLSMAVLGDPEEFPVTVSSARDPVNWYGRTKLLNERTIEVLADGAFTAIQLLISNLYGQHTVDGERLAKPTVINFFAERALAGEPLPVYAPGTQSRDFVHVEDVAHAVIRGLEFGRLQARDEAAGSWTFPIASGEDPSVMDVAEMAQAAARRHAGAAPPIEVVDNPRDDEALTESFPVDTTAASALLDWTPERSVFNAIDELVATMAE